MHTNTHRHTHYNCEWKMGYMEGSEEDEEKKLQKTDEFIYIALKIINNEIYW